MPSFYSLATLAIAFASLSPILASEIDISPRAINLADSIISAEALEKRAPAGHQWPHHHRGHHHRPTHHHSPKPVPKPGNNFGARCRNDWSCRSDVRYSKAVCEDWKCSFECLGDTHKDKKNQFCTGKFHAPTCRYDHQCKTRVLNARGSCNDGKCIFSCNSGYHAEKNTCVKNKDTCNRRRCRPVEDGYNLCQNGHCEPHCPHYGGFQLYYNPSDDLYKCVNTANDAKNCGEYGHVCPPPYNGKGWPKCSKGHCTIDCTGWRHVRYTNGQPYCSNI